MATQSHSITQKALIETIAVIMGKESTNTMSISMQEYERAYTTAERMLKGDKDGHYIAVWVDGDYTLDYNPTWKRRIR